MIMKICMVTADSAKGGIEKHLLDLIHAIPPENKITPIKTNHLRDQVHENISTLNLNWGRSRHNPLLYLDLYKIFTRNQFDIVHTHGGKATFCLGILKKFLSFPLISTLHNNRLNKPRPYIYADHVIGVSKNVFLSFGENFKSKSVIYNGAAIAPVEDCIKHKIQSHFSHPDLPLLLGVGRLVKAKGFDLLIEAMESVEANLYLVGDGPLRGELQQKIVDSKLTGKIFMAGHQSNINQIMQSVDACIISSRNEGFSYVALEALLNKTLIASTNVACAEFLPNDVLLDEDPTGMGNKIQELLNDRNTWNNTLKEYFDYAANEMTIKAMTNKTLLAYKDLIKGS